MSTIARGHYYMTTTTAGLCIAVIGHTARLLTPEGVVEIRTSELTEVKAIPNN